MAGIYHNPELGVISMSSDGTNWLTIADKNLGATQVYNDGDALSEANSGKYYQWGNNHGFPFTGSITTSSSQVNASAYGPFNYNYYESSTFITVPGTSNNNDWSSVHNDNLWGRVIGTNEAMRGPCPEGFHMPLITEWEGLKTIMDGLGLTTGNDWKINLHLPLVGRRYGTSATIINQGDYACYWSSSPYGSTYPDCARYFSFYSSDIHTDRDGYRADGYSVRGFKNSFEVPTSSWTVITGTLGGAGIFWNQTDGLISITSDGTTGYTIQDKNLGATIVYYSGDTLTQANMGNMYQWGNNYGFPSTGSVTSSSTKVDASSYGVTDYYDSDTFIITNTSPYDWSSSPNNNLWGDTTNTNIARKGPCNEGYHIPSVTERNSVLSIMTGFGFTNGSYYKTYLFAPPVGTRLYTTGSANSQGSIFYYWASSMWPSNEWGGAINMEGTVEISGLRRATGVPIRPFANEPVVPDYTWERLYGDEIPVPVPKKNIKRFQNNGNYYYFGEPPVHITSITLNESSLTLDTVGDTYQLTATIDNPDACDTHIYWSSSDNTIATVMNTGLVKCIKPGDCTITASCDGITATCSISYTKVTGVTLNKGFIQLTNVGDTYQLEATITPSTAAYKTVTWSSSDDSIATVDNTGLVTCVSVGECTITCTTDDLGYTATCMILQELNFNVKYMVVGGGAGGGALSGGGGGAVCLGCTDASQGLLNVSIGTGGTGIRWNNYTTSGNYPAYPGGISKLCNDTVNISAAGGCIAGGPNTSPAYCGGASGSGFSGGRYCSCCCCGAGGGGASGNGCAANAGGCGGKGICGYGGGGGGVQYYNRGPGVDGGGNGGQSQYSSYYLGCNATNCGGGGGASASDSYGSGGNGANGLVEICYILGGGCGFNTATGGNICCTVTVDGVTYCVHRFTSNGTFTITG